LRGAADRGLPGVLPNSGATGRRLRRPVLTAAGARVSRGRATRGTQFQAALRIGQHALPPTATESRPFRPHASDPRNSRTPLRQRGRKSRDDFPAGGAAGLFRDRPGGRCVPRKPNSAIARRGRDTRTGLVCVRRALTGASPGWGHCAFGPAFGAQGVLKGQPRGCDNFSGHCAGVLASGRSHVPPVPSLAESGRT